MSGKASRPDWDYAIIGRRFRSRRRELGLSIKELSEVTGISRYTLMRIEKGFPCRDSTIRKVRPVLRLFTDQLVKPKESTEHFGLHRGSDTRWLVSIPKGKYSRVTPQDDLVHVDEDEERMRLGSLGLQPFFTAIFSSHLPEGHSTHGIMELYQPSWVDQHYGEEFLYCLQGAALMTINGEECVIEQGDAICFDARLPHSYAPAKPYVKGEPPTRILLVVISRPGELDQSKMPTLQTSDAIRKEVGRKAVLLSGGNPSEPKESQD